MAPGGHCPVVSKLRNPFALGPVMPIRPVRIATAPALNVVLTALFVLSGFSGCVTDSAPYLDSASLVEAHNVASERAKELDRSALLVGFVANDRLSGIPAPEWLLKQVGTVPAGGAGVADGTASAWVLLYATSEGGVIRALVQDGVELEVVGQADPVAQALWRLNLGGRLLVDSDEAVAAARASDPDFDAHAQAKENAGAAVVSSIAEVEPGMMDLVYAVFWGPASDEQPFSRFAYVHHFTGAVVKSGDASSYREVTRAVLVDETFTLGPVPHEAHQEEELGIEVEDAVMRLNVTGVGNYTVRLIHENRSEVARIDGVALVEAQERVEELGTLPSGLWVLQVEVVGQVEFHLRIEGVVPVRPDGLPA